MLQRKDKYVQFHALQQRRINVDKYHVILLYHKTLNIQYNNQPSNTDSLHVFSEASLNNTGGLIIIVVHYKQQQNN